MDMDTRVSDFWELEVSLGYRVFRYYIKSQNQRQAILLSTYFLDGFIAKENQGWISKLIASLPSPQPYFWYCRRLYQQMMASPSKPKLIRQ